MAKLAINEATTMKATFEQDVAAYAAAGFEAIELWLGKLTPFLEGNSIEDARRLLDDNGLSAVSACYHSGVMLTTGEARAKNLDDFRSKLETCEALGCPVLIVPTDFVETAVAEDYDRAVDGLAEAGEIAAPHGVSLAIEFIKGAKFVASMATATAMVRKTGCANVGVLFDTFHFFAGVSKTEDILDLKPGELVFVHLNDMRDMPVEIAQDSDRVLPGEGVMPLRAMLDAVAGIGYEGYYCVELFAEDLWAMSAQEAAKLTYDKTTAFFGA